METQVEREFQGFRDRIENIKLVASLCKQIEAEIGKVADEHESIGKRGMAARAKVMKNADLERFNGLSDEYTMATMEAVPAMMSLFESLGGVLQGAAAMHQHVSEINN